MPRRPLVLPTAALLLACLAVLPACKKNKPDGGGGGVEPGPDGVPPAASSEYVLFARLNVKDVLDNPLFAEIKQAVDKAGGTAEWDKMEQEFAKEIGGLKPTDIDAVTACVTEVPPRGVPKFIVILTARKSIDKTSVFGLGPQSRPDARGFYNARKQGEGGLLHFPDDKTLVLVHPDLAQKYLDGYAKDRTGWPLTGELTGAAAGHTLFATAQLTKLPPEIVGALGKAEGGEFAPLLAVRALTLTADLKGKELSVAARATFPDAAAAGKARDTVRNLIGMALGEIDKVMAGKELPELTPLMPAVKEAHRALKEAKVEVSGSDLTVAGSYKADFDITAMINDAVPKIR